MEQKLEPPRIIAVSGMGWSGASAVVDYLRGQPGTLLPQGSEPKVFQFPLRVFRSIRSGESVRDWEVEEALGQVYGRSTERSGDAYYRKRCAFLDSLGRTWADWNGVSVPLGRAVEELARIRKSKSRAKREAALQAFLTGLRESMQAFEALFGGMSNVVVLDNLYRMDRDAATWTRNFRNGFLIGVHRDPRDHLAERRRQGSRISARNFAERYAVAMPDEDVEVAELGRAAPDVLYVPFEHFVVSEASRAEVLKFCGLVSDGGDGERFSSAKSRMNVGIWRDRLERREVEVLERRLGGYFRDL